MSRTAARMSRRSFRLSGQLVCTQVCAQLLHHVRVLHTFTSDSSSDTASMKDTTLS